MIKLLRQCPAYVPVIFIALLAVLPLWQPGFLNTKAAGETSYLLARVQQLSTALGDGVFPVRWLPDGAYGLGYPFFNFYGAFPYYIAAILHLLGFGIVVSLKITHTLGFMIGALGMYHWLRRHVRYQSAALLAATVFTFAPMRMINIYVRGDSLSEFWAMGLFPVILWAIDRVIERPRPSSVIGLAISAAVLVMTHNISALIFLPLAAIYGLWRSWTKIRIVMITRLTGLAAGAVLALLLSAWFWLPALTERGTVQTDGRMLEGYFYWGNNFLDGQLIQRGLATDYVVFPPRLGLWQTILAAAGIACAMTGFICPKLKQYSRRGGSETLLPAPLSSSLPAKGLFNKHPDSATTAPILRAPTASDDGRATRSGVTDSPSPASGKGLGDRVGMAHPASLPVAFWVTATFALSIALTQSFSAPAYEHVTALTYLQFTWRWLTIAALSGAAMAAYAIDLWSPARLRHLLGGALITITIIGGLIRLDLDFMPIPESDITVERLAEREFYSGDIGTTVTTEYLPTAVMPRFFSGPLIIGRWELKVLDGAASGGLLERQSARAVWHVDVSGASATVAVPLLYWPGWTAHLEDGAPLDVSAVDGIGWIQMTIPPGDHTVTLELHNTSIRWTANTLSLLGLAIVMAVTGGVFKRQYRCSRAGVFSSPSPVRRGGRGVRWGGVTNARCLLIHSTIILTLATLLILALARQNSTPTGPYATQFWRNSYRHAYTYGLNFSDGARLLDYRYPTEISPGESLVIDLEWEQSATAQAELIPPLVNLWQVDAALSFGMGENSIELPIPPDAAPGLYFVRLIHAGEIYDLTPVRIAEGAPPSNDAWIADLGDELRLLNVRAAGISRGRLNVYLSWAILRPITENYSLALRLYSPAGEPLVAYDGPMGVYGAYSPIYWSDFFADWVSLTGLGGLPPGEGYRLIVTVYTGAGALGRAEIRNLAIRESPQQSSQSDTEFTGVVTLPSEPVEQGDSLLVLCQWRGAVEADWQIEWAFDADQRVITSLAPGARLDWWRPDQQYRAVVPVPVVVDIPPGTYTLHWRIINTGDAAVTPVQNAGTITVAPTTRVFAPADVSPLATFGAIQLLDYAIQQTGNALILNLTWGLSERLDSDYTLFVHVVNPADGYVVAQTDTMPRNNTYPVTAWLAGEMVEDTVPVDLTGVGAGGYTIVLGWYNPFNPAERLPAYVANGNPLPDNRLALSEPVTIP